MSAAFDFREYRREQRERTARLNRGKPAVIEWPVAKLPPPPPPAPTVQERPRDILDLKPTVYQEMRRLVAKIAEEHGVTTKEIYGHRRFAGVTKARQKAFVAVAEASGWTCTKIAMFFDKDHSTILHAIYKHRRGEL